MVRRIAAQRGSRIATVAVGYADGYLRAFSNRGSGLPRPASAYPSSDGYRWT